MVATLWGAKIGNTVNAGNPYPVVAAFQVVSTMCVGVTLPPEAFHLMSVTVVLLWSPSSDAHVPDAGVVVTAVNFADDTETLGLPVDPVQLILSFDVRVRVPDAGVLVSGGEIFVFPMPWHTSDPVPVTTSLAALAGPALTNSAPVTSDAATAPVANLRNMSTPSSDSPTQEASPARTRTTRPAQSLAGNGLERIGGTTHVELLM